MLFIILYYKWAAATAADDDDDDDEPYAMFSYAIMNDKKGDFDVIKKEAVKWFAILFA